MVPVWDAVNHVTGQCNTRLHHCAESGALQMIATAPIPQGQQVRARMKMKIDHLIPKSRQAAPTVKPERFLFRECTSPAATTKDYNVKSESISHLTADPQTGYCGVQVINNFGPLSNAELLRRYGFVECSQNPHDCVEFSVGEVVQVSIQQDHSVPFLLQSMRSYHSTYRAPTYARDPVSSMNAFVARIHRDMLPLAGL